MFIGSARKSYQNEDECIVQSHTWQARLMILHCWGRESCDLLPGTSLSACFGDELKGQGP